MNGNRGQYTSAPLNNMKNKRPTPPPHSGEQPARFSGKRRFQALAAVLSLVLPVLFLLALLIPSGPLRWAFLILTAVSLAAMWLLRAFVKNARGTLTIVYGALAVVIGLALFIDGQAPESRNVSSRIQDQGALFTNPDAAQRQNALAQSLTTPEPTAAASNAVSAAQQQLETFLVYWAQGNIPEMLKLCTPSWTAQQQSPEATLYQMIRNGKPTNYQIENVSGSDGDTSRTITLKATLDYQNGIAPTLCRLQVLMFRVNDVWYVDPQSLGGTPIDEAAESAQASVANPNLGSTKAPTPTPIPADSADAQLLYYNKDGGKYYHAIRNCPAVDERYWPLDEFYYSDLNSQQFKNLIRCTTCNAPQRPSVN